VDGNVAVPSTRAVEVSDELQGSLRIRLRWLDWLADDPIQFDLQAMLDFCQQQQMQGWSARIENALGRLGEEFARTRDDSSSVGEVSFQFGTRADQELFLDRFASVVSRTIIDVGPPAHVPP
jgi:hypothetical protein